MLFIPQSVLGKLLHKNNLLLQKLQKIVRTMQGLGKIDGNFTEIEICIAHEENKSRYRHLQ